jgi:predicted nucleic-acid-binding Zn-ribbon protein
MSAWGKKLRHVTDGYSNEYIAHMCPGCGYPHLICYKIVGNKTLKWDWDGNIAEPTVNPSMRLSDKQGTHCHYHLTKGKIVFADDCRHALNRQTVDIPDWPYAPGEYGGIDD